MNKLLKFISASALLAAGGVQAQVVVVMGNGGTVTQVTREQVTAIFLGRSQQFPGGQKALPVDNSNENVREKFSSQVLGKSPAQVKSIWSRLIFSGTAAPPKEVADSAAVKAFVNTHPGAIGYIDAAAIDSSVKVVLPGS